MTPLPSDPMALKGRVFDALCEGISDGTVFQRLDAIHSILNQGSPRKPNKRADSNS